MALQIFNQFDSFYKNLEKILQKLATGECQDAAVASWISDQTRVPSGAVHVVGLFETQVIFFKCCYYYLTVDL